jgi:hypothetical protein
VSFLALPAPAAFALLAGVALAIVLLYLLKPPPARRVISSVLVWAKVARARKRPPARRLLSLLLALAIGLSLALALARPELHLLAGGARRLVLVLDDSPSMATKMGDGRTRWEHALDRARALLAGTSATTQVKLLDSVGRLAGRGFVERDAALAALEGLPAVAFGRPRPLPAAALEAAQVHLFTDGVAPYTGPRGALEHAVFEPADNVAVTAFEARPHPQDPTRYEALVQVLNASPRDRRVRLLVSGGERFSITQDLDLRAGESVDASFDVSDFEGGVLGAAALSDGDAFALDDLAYAVVAPHRPRRVLLVSHGDLALEDALRHLPGTRLTVISPQRYRAPEKFDALVLDRFAPVDPPGVGAVLLAPPTRAWLGAASTPVLAPVVAGWDEASPLTRAVVWRNLRLTRASLSVPVDGATALVRAAGHASGALVSAGKALARWVRLGFALPDSNFALQADFPVFLGNALNWVTETDPVLARALGSIEVPLRAAQVRDGDGKPVAVSVTDRGIVFEATQPDVFSVTAAGREVLVVANLADPRVSLVNASRFAAAAAAPDDASRPAPFALPEPWIVLLVVAAALLLVDWAAFTRRYTS